LDVDDVGSRGCGGGRGSLGRVGSGGLGLGVLGSGEAEGDACDEKEEKCKASVRGGSIRARTRRKEGRRSRLTPLISRINTPILDALPIRSLPHRHLQHLQPRQALIQLDRALVELFLQRVRRVQASLRRRAGGRTRSIGGRGEEVVGGVTGVANRLGLLGGLEFAGVFGFGEEFAVSLGD
jgi:hypothetical protein